MKEYLVDVPVVLYLFIRPDTLKKVFSVIKEARPSTLFLVSDGPRKKVFTDAEQINKSREIVEDIDWDCKVYKLYSEENQGMYRTFKSSMDQVFSKVDRAIFLEDDVVVELSFFKFCEELLKKYENDLRVNMICGMNHLGEYSNPKSDYFFSKAASIWGYAIWKRTYELFNDFSYAEDEYIVKNLVNNSSKYKAFQRELLEYVDEETYNGKPAGPEFFLGLSVFSQNQLNIIARKNMVCNIGFGSNATHAQELKKMPKAVQNMFNMKTFNYNFPLKHPKYVVEDKIYEDLLFKLMGRGKIRSLIRQTNKIFRHVYYGDFKFLINRFKKKILRRTQIEK